MRHVYDDGGRARAGFNGTTGDCVTRAIATAMQLDYTEVYQLVNGYGDRERRTRRRRKRGPSSARTGVYKQTTKKIIEDLGWVWVPTMGIGTGCKVHLKAEELPNGRLIVNLSKHITCVVDGVIHDTYDPSRGETRCVYGYWHKRPKLEPDPAHRSCPDCREELCEAIPLDSNGTCHGCGRCYGKTIFNRDKETGR